MSLTVKQYIFSLLGGMLAVLIGLPLFPNDAIPWLAIIGCIAGYILGSRERNGKFIISDEKRKQMKAEEERIKFENQIKPLKELLMRLPKEQVDKLASIYTSIYVAIGSHTNLLPVELVKLGGAIAAI